MNTSEIEVLLEKYYEGETSLAEEQLLRDFFLQKDVPAHLKSHQPLFTFFARERPKEISSEDFEHSITIKIQAENIGTGVIPAQPKPGRLWYYTGIAATILLLVSLFYTYQHDIFNPRKSNKMTANTTLAYADANEALRVVSVNLNTGLKQVARLQMVDNAMKKIQIFNKFYQYQTIIINPDENQTQSIKLK